MTTKQRKCCIFMLLFGLLVDALTTIMVHLDSDLLWQQPHHNSEENSINATQTLRKTSTFSAMEDNMESNKDDDDKGLKANQTHWCVISPHSSSRTAARYSHHFPHAAENILPCWSWFVQQNATQHCGLVYLTSGNFRHFVSPISDNDSIPVSWQEQLVRRMGCQVQEIEVKKTTNVEHPLETGPDAPIQHTVPLQLKLPRLGRIMYLERQRDADTLRRLFFSDEWINQHKGGTKPLQVGVLQRKISRSITNLDDLVQGLHDALPTANITVTTMDTPWLEEQAAWFATKDVIISPHGAALTNAIFCTPGTIVMQLYSKNYFWQSLESLIEASGAVALDWYAGNSPISDMANSGYRGRNAGRIANITTPVQEIVEPILYALGRKPHTLYDLVPSRHQRGE